jgi:hypothetical protein
MGRTFSFYDFSPFDQFSRNELSSLNQGIIALGFLSVKTGPTSNWKFQILCLAALSRRAECPVVLFLVIRHLSMRPLRFSEMSGTTDSVTWRHKPERRPRLLVCFESDTNDQVAVAQVLLVLSAWLATYWCCVIGKKKLNFVIELPKNL